MYIFLNTVSSILYMYKYIGKNTLLEANVLGRRLFIFLISAPIHRVGNIFGEASGQ